VLNRLSNLCDVGRPALILAALAADAAPGKSFRNFRRVSDNPDLEILELWDEKDNPYNLMVPVTTAGVAEQAQLLQGLRAISKVSGELPFEVPAVIGTSSDGEGNTAVVITMVSGQSPDLSRYAPGAFSKTFAAAMAAIHKLDPAVVRDFGLVEHDASSVLQSKVQELDKAAGTGRVPAKLLSRWEEALEDVGLFRFHTTVTHGTVSQDSIYVSDQSVVAVSDFSHLSISDPAEDLKYLAGGALPSTFEDALLHYRSIRESADENIQQRSQLYSELELASWLNHCLATGEERAISDAEAMLEDLAEQLEAGTLRSLRAASFIGLGAAAAAVVTASEPATQEPAQVAEATSDDSEPEPEVTAELPSYDSGESSLDELF